MTEPQELFTNIHGKIKFFDRRRGYGFIVSDFVNEDIFFHFTSMTDLKNEIFLGTDIPLIFDICKGSKGIHAKNISYEEKCLNYEAVNYKRFVLYLGGIINEEIKKNKNKIRH
ncbi:hypothetical protein P3W45_000459 [Vairimorpha bombi]|jgi:cold shock CspA family protein